MALFSMMLLPARFRVAPRPPTIVGVAETPFTVSAPPAVIDWLAPVVL